jgi:4-hydroxy-tetrahydrodipicolinate reductase
MKIALIGYGKMGQTIEKVTQKTNHEIVAKIDPKSKQATAAKISAENLNNAEIAIDFTHPTIVVENLRKLSDLKISAVVGTTGWYEHLSEVEKIATNAGTGILYAGNFSLGVNIFYAIVSEAAKRLAKINKMDVAIHEIHHTGKADAPSGTARELSMKILKNFPSKKRVLLDNTEQPVPKDALQISATRLGKVVGIHTVAFDGFSDSIELIHRGKNRDGYAMGAIMGAEWLAGKTGIFSVEDWLHKT